MSLLSKWFRSPSRPRPVRKAAPRLEALEDRRLMSVGFNNGALLPNVKVETVYWGSDWYKSSSAQLAQQYDTFFKTITNSSYMDLLNQYNVGRGSFMGEHVITDYKGPTKVVNEQAIVNMLDYEIRSYNDTNHLPAPDANTLYVVVLPPNVEASAVIGGSTQTSGFENGLKHFYAYHDSAYDPGIGNLYYAVIANPTGNIQIPGLDVFQQMTEVGSHELAEAVTNPSGGGWYDTNPKSPTKGQEIGDLANLLYGNYQGFTVQQEYSNKANGPVMPKSDASNVLDYRGQMTSIQAVTNADGREELFGMTSDGVVWHKSQSKANVDSWNNWTRLDGLSGVKSFQVGLNKASRQLEVFAIDANSHVQTITQTVAPNWGGHWSTLGGSLYPSSLKVQSISIGLSASGYQQVFAIDTNNEVRTWSAVHSPIGWYQTWLDLGEKAQALKVYSYDNGQMELFGIDMSGQAVHSWQTSTGFSAWYGLGGGKVLSIDVGRDADGMPELFAIRADHAVETIKHAYSADWGKAWTNLGGWVSSISVGTNKDGRLEVFGVWSDRSLYTISQMAPRDDWKESVWFKMGGSFKDSLSAGHEADGRLDIFGVSTSGDTMSYRQTIPSGSWN
jgi:hypothetical protein